MRRPPAEPRKSAARCDLRIDALYECRPDEFTAARDDLVHALRDAGEADCAALVEALRRPTAAVWAINQLARHHGEKRTARLTARARADAARLVAERVGVRADEARARLTTTERAAPR